MSSPHSSSLGRRNVLCRPPLLAAAVLAFAALAAVSAWAGTAIPTKASDFTTTDPAGASRSLAQYLNARPILLEFMSPDCPHCVEMAPLLGRVHKIYGDRVQFLTVAFDKSARRVQQFAQTEKHAWPYLIGTQAIIDAYRLEGVPTFYLLTPDGRVAERMVGSMPEATLREKLDVLLNAR